MANTILEQWKKQTSFVTDSDFKKLLEWENQNADLEIPALEEEQQKIIDQEIEILHGQQIFLPLQPLSAGNQIMHLSYDDLKKIGINQNKLEILLIKRDIVSKLIHLKKLKKKITE